MYNSIVMAHDGWRWIVILIGLVFLIKMILGMVQKSKWSKLDRQLGLFTTIAVDIQVLLGLIVWGVGLAGKAWWTASMSVPPYMEHPVTMLVAVTVMHIGWARAKKASTDAGKFQQALIWFAVAGLLIALGISQVTGGAA